MGAGGAEELVREENERKRAFAGEEVECFVSWLNKGADLRE